MGQRPRRGSLRERARRILDDIDRQREAYEEERGSLERRLEAYGRAERRAFPASWPGVSFRLDPFSNRRFCQIDLDAALASGDPTIVGVAATLLGGRTAAVEREPVAD